MKKNSLQSYKVQCRTKIELKTTNQIKTTSQNVEFSRRALWLQAIVGFFRSSPTTAYHDLAKKAYCQCELNHKSKQNRETFWEKTFFRPSSL